MANNHGGKREGSGRKKAGEPKFGHWTAVEEQMPEDLVSVLVATNTEVFNTTDSRYKGKWLIHVSASIAYWMPKPPVPIYQGRGKVDRTAYSFIGGGMPLDTVGRRW